jgi:hypothetical protein
VIDTRPTLPTTARDPIAERDENGCNREPETMLSHAHGPIPTFLPRALHDHGRRVPLTPEELEVRSDSAVRALRALRQLPDGDPPGTDRAMRQGIGANRPRGLELFEGMS